MKTHTRTFDKLVKLIFGASSDIPDSALETAATLLLDTVGVAAGATPLDAGRIARNFAADFYAAPNPDLSAPLMFDGRHASLPGAAYASATQIDNLDAHDGYNPTRGHIGCAAVPALFAFTHAQPKLSGRDALAALVISYEIAARAGIALHSTVSDYHTSGAWNALGVVAMGCRLLGHDDEIMRQAMGIAEYHGPRSQMMREIENPTMLHDGSGMGAFVGVSATLLASRGFQGAPAITVEDENVAQIWEDLGANWTIEKNYIKPYPICRWAHAAIDAVQQLMVMHKFKAEDVASLEVRTFHQAAQLYPGMPQTISQAQYSLHFAVAVMLQYGHIGPMHVSGAALSDPNVGDVIGRITVVEKERHSSRFPESRWSDVSVELSDGRVFESGDVHARGGPEAPMSNAEIRGKFGVMCNPVIGENHADKIWQTGRKLVEQGSVFSDFSRLICPAPSRDVK